MSNFVKWFRVRHNIPDEVISEAWPWSKTLDSLRNDPKFQDRVSIFAKNLGLDVVGDASLWQSLSKIVAVRIYGSKKMGAIELSDLAHVWQSLQEKVVARSKKSPTIAQKYGITRPKAIPTKVPGAQTTVQWSLTQGAAEFDLEEYEKSRRGGDVSSVAGPPSGGRTKPGQGTAPVGPGSSSGGSGSDPFTSLGQPGSPARVAASQALDAVIAPLVVKEKAAHGLIKKGSGFTKSDRDKLAALQRTQDFMIRGR